MKRAANLARFTVVAAALVWGFAFNAAAYVAWVLYVILPDTRITGAPPMHWATPTSDLTNGLRHAGGPEPLTIVCVAVCGLLVLYCILVPRKERAADQLS